MILAPKTTSLANTTRRNQLLATLLFGGLAAAASATDYSASAAIDSSVSYNDNLRMTQSDKTAVRKYQVVPTLSLNADTETSSFRLQSIFYFNYYDKSEFNSNDQNIGVAYSKKFESSEVGVNANLVRDSTITSEELGSGRIGDTAERTDIYQVAPYWSYYLNETNLLQLTSSYTQQNYKSRNYIGYKQYGGGLDWIHVYNERLKLVTSANYSKYESDDSQDFPSPLTGFTVYEPVDIGGISVLVPVRFTRGQFGNQTYSTRTEEKRLQVGADYEWSEATKLQARLGASRSETEYPVSDPQNICSNTDYLELVRAGLAPYVGGLCGLEPSDSTLFTAELDWTWKSERNQLNLSTTKSTQPTSNGYMVDAWQVASTWTYALSERDQIKTDLTLVRNRTINESSRSSQTTSAGNRNYGTVLFSYSRQLNELWSVTGSYRYSKQQYTDLDYSAAANVFSIGIRYQPQRWDWAR